MSLHNRLFACLGALLACGGSSFAAVNIDITGGNGSPLVIYLPAISYEITEARSSNIFLAFTGTNLTPFGARTPIGDVTLSINGGEGISFVYGISNYNGVDIDPGDLYFYTDPMPLSVGDIVTVSAGTLTFSSSYADPAPGSLSVESFIATSSVRRISNDGVQAPVVPEPSTYAAIAGALGLAFVALRRRKA
ncbi:MAG: PEP-CTERM sorting domain-containing protein [Verrucomicrobiota bacterium JB022]|nr:PEP-CTERM sorting domain-containing protein [Verrucomicrobiota bacterium JB022]